MTDMQRWASPIGEMTEAVNGRYVLASDAEAAIAAAVEDFRAAMSEGTWYQSGRENGYEQGQRDMLAQCIAAVEALDVCWYADNACQSPNHGILNDVYLALRALQEKP